MDFCFGSASNFDLGVSGNLTVCWVSADILYKLRAGTAMDVIGVISTGRGAVDVVIAVSVEWADGAEGAPADSASATAGGAGVSGAG